VAGLGVWAGDIKPGTTSPASLKGLTSSFGPPLPLLGGRAVGFSRGPVTVASLRLLVRRRLLPPTPSLLGIGSTGVGIGLGAVRGGLIWPTLVRLQSLLDARLVAKKMRDGRGQSSRVGPMDLAAEDSQTKCLRSSMPWLMEPAAMADPTLAIFLRPLRMSARSSLVSFRACRRDSAS
jgi:hypothetical protein